MGQLGQCFRWQHRPGLGLGVFFDNSTKPFFSERDDHARLAEDCFARHLFEASVMDQDREIVLIRQFQRGSYL